MFLFSHTDKNTVSHTKLCDIYAEVYGDRAISHKSRWFPLKLIKWTVAIATILTIGKGWRLFTLKIPFKPSKQGTNLPTESNKGFRVLLKDSSTLTLGEHGIEQGTLQTPSPFRRILYKVST